MRIVILQATKKRLTLRCNAVLHTNLALKRVGPNRDTPLVIVKGGLLEPFQHCIRRLIVLLPPNEFLHSSPEAPRTTLARDLC